MSEEMWKVIKCKFEATLESWEIDKKCNQFTVDSICSLFPTEMKAIIDYIEQLQQENQQLKEELQKANDTLDTHNELIKYQKSILDEIREYIKECTSSPDEYENFISTSEVKHLLQILDKVKE